VSGDIYRATLDEIVALFRRVRDDAAPQVAAASAAIAGALAAGGKLLLFGNGGSASDAQHVASELVNRFQRDRGALAAVALTADSSVLTSIGNDYGFERVFARQIEALGRPGDVALGISTSGESPNVLAALETARRRGLTTVAFTGRSGGALGAAAAIHVNVPSDVTARIQEVHRALLHIVCDLVERGIVVD
jgi:D-sedoheptulose 7-phosphate isomerase